jgi:hypothetical protein
MMKCPACQRLLCELNLRDGSVLMRCRGTRDMPKHWVRFSRKPGDDRVAVDVDTPRMSVLV